MLKPLIGEKNQAHSRYLQVSTRSCKKNFRGSSVWCRRPSLIQKEVDFESGHRR